MEVFIALPRVQEGKRLRNACPFTFETSLRLISLIRWCLSHKGREAVLFAVDEVSQLQSGLTRHLVLFPLYGNA